MAILLCHVNKKHPKQKSDYIVGNPQCASSFLLFYFYFRYKLYIIFKKIPRVLKHLPETVLYGYNIFVVGHAVPGVIGLQNLHGHLTFNLSYS